MENNSFNRSETGLFFLMIIALGLASFSAGYYLGIRKGNRTQPNLLAKEKIEQVAPGPSVPKLEKEVKTIISEKTTDALSSKENKKTEQVQRDGKEYPFEIINKDNDIFVGKWCILVGSFESLNEAKDFAAGFIVRGYEPLIRESELKGVGILYKVSLGRFETIDSAKEFLNEESSLFEGSQYPIEKIE